MRECAQHLYQQAIIYVLILRSFSLRQYPRCHKFYKRKLAPFCWDIFLCCHEGAQFAASETTEYLISSWTQSTCAVLYWALVGGCTELKPFSALGKAPGLPWAAACLTAWVFSAMELCPCNSVRFKNEGNLKMHLAWHLPFGWPVEPSSSRLCRQGRQLWYDQHPATAACPGLGLCWEESGLGWEGRQHLAPPGKGRGGKHYKEAREGRAMWTSVGGQGGASSQWGEKK